MSLDPTEELSKATGRFPFAMAVTAIFFSGSVFVLFNGPLIRHYWKVFIRKQIYRRFPFSNASFDGNYGGHTQ